jgi:hypothetical protein
MLANSSLTSSKFLSCLLAKIPRVTIAMMVNRARARIPESVARAGVSKSGDEIASRIGPIRIPNTMEAIAIRTSILAERLSLASMTRDLYMFTLVCLQCA